MATMATKRDYYEVLSVSRDASEQEISRTYRKLAIRYHPDSHPGDEEATTRFKEAAEAYEVLIDREKRSRYDRFGHAGVNGPGGGAGSTDVEDIFDAFGDIFGGGIFGDIFGGGGGRGRRRSRVHPGADIKCEVTLTLAEAARGVTRKVEFDRSEICDQCRGSGSRPGSTGETCRRCNGRGQVVQSAGILRVQTSCPSCHGSGQVIVDPCEQCRGQVQWQNVSSWKFPFRPESTMARACDSAAKANQAATVGHAATATASFASNPIRFSSEMEIDCSWKSPSPTRRRLWEL